MADDVQGPPRRIRLIGRTMNGLVARAPWLWPALKGPMRGYFDDRARDWDTRTSAGSVEHLTALATAVIHVETTPERVLDVGTGTGVAALFLAREYPRASVRGVDFSEEMIAAAKAKVGLDPEGRIAFKVADASSLPFTDDSFDLITHVNVPPFFAEVARVLRPGGYVVVRRQQWGLDPLLHPALGSLPRAREARDRNRRKRERRRRHLRRRPRERRLRAAQSVVRVLRQRLAPVVGDEEQVFEAHAADALEALDAGLDRDHVPGDERVCGAEPERRWLVHLEADAVAEAEVEPVRESLSRLPRALGREPGALDDLCRDVVEGAAGDPGPCGRARRFDRLADDLVQARRPRR